MIPLFKVLMTQAAIETSAAVLASGYIGQGRKVDEFEAALQTKLGSLVPILTVNSCTSALDLALRLAGVRPGDEVITTAMTCTATNSPIVTQGAVPVWADVDPCTGLIDPGSVAGLVGSKTRAIMAVDWSGAPCDYASLNRLGLPVIEDAAHAFLALDRTGAPVAETGGTYVCWSFQAIKHLTTVDGGALRCPERHVDSARLLRWYGLDRRSGESFRCQQDIQDVGFKYHMNDVAAAIGLANLPEAISAVARHRLNAEFYHDALKNLRGVSTPPKNPNSAWWLYTMRVENRPSFESFMRDNGVAVSPVHARNDQHAAFARVAHRPLATPGLDHFASHEVAIPVGWWLSSEDLCYIADKVILWSKTL